MHGFSGSIVYVRYLQRYGSLTNTYYLLFRNGDIMVFSTALASLQNPTGLANPLTWEPSGRQRKEGVMPSIFQVAKFTVVI